MKISLQYIQKFLPLSADFLDHAEEKITLHTSEVEEIIENKEYFKDVVAGKVTNIVPHKTSDKLSVASVNMGSHGTHDIVFGSVLGLTTGMLVPVALPGAHLASGMHIQSSQIQGQGSHGMICIGTELGFKHEGILNIPQNTKPGTAFSDISQYLADTIVDIDNKSLTHRPDLMGHRGFVREIAAITKQTPQWPQTTLTAGDATLDIAIESPHCKRFCMIGINNTQVQPSDFDTQCLLENVGVRTISNLVDITNQMMIQYGQPMHVFDADKVQGKITIRQAKNGESLLALDGETYELSSDDIVIADEEQILSIAGIMGGLDSAVTNDTTNILFEAANFDATTIRKTSTRLGLRSDSSMRFEKSLDPEQCKHVLMGAAAKTQEICPNSVIVSQIFDAYPQPQKPLSLELKAQKVRDIMGVDMPTTDMVDILRRLDFTVVDQKDTLHIIVPSFRATKDISITEDIIEEIVRIYGFDALPSTLPVLSVKPPQTNTLRILQNQLRQFFAANGIQEYFGYSFVNDADQTLTKSNDYVTIQNPLSSSHTALRKTLLSSLIINIESELRTQKNVNLFEIGKVYIPQKSEILPKEIYHFSLFAGSMEIGEDSVFQSTKSVFERFLQNKKVPYKWDVPTHNIPPYAHPSKVAQLTVNGQSWGYICIIHPLYNPVQKSSIVFLEIDIEAMHNYLHTQQTLYTQLSPFPSVNRDIAIIVDERTFVGDIQATIQQCSTYTRSVSCFDEYHDEEKIGKGKKNLAFHIVLQSDTKTLTDQDTQSDINSITQALQDKHGAQIRLDF